MNTMTNIELVIFDCDGILVDTDPLRTEVLSEVASEFGWATTREQSVQRFGGRSTLDCLRRISAFTGSPEAELNNAFQERIHKVLERDLLPIHGALTVLNEIGVPCAVAANEPVEQLRFKLRITGLLPWIGRRVYGSEWAKKRKVDVALLPAIDQEVVPERCLRVSTVAKLLESPPPPQMRAVAIGELPDGADLSPAVVCVIGEIRQILGHF